MSSGQADWTLFAFSYSNFLFHGETSTFVWLFVKVQGLKMAKTVWKSERKIKMVDFLLCLGIRCTRQQVDASPLNWLVFFFEGQSHRFWRISLLFGQHPPHCQSLSLFWLLGASCVQCVSGLEQDQKSVSSALELCLSLVKVL